jgi:hypothetical protein
MKFFKLLATTLVAVAVSATASAGSNGRGSSVNGDSITVSAGDAREIAARLYTGLLDRQGAARDVENVAQSLQAVHSKNDLLTVVQQFCYKLYGRPTSEFQDVVLRDLRRGDGDHIIAKRLYSSLDVGVTSTRQYYINKNLLISKDGQAHWAVIDLLVQLLGQTNTPRFSDTNDNDPTPLVYPVQFNAAKNITQALLYSLGRGVDDSGAQWLMAELQKAQSVGQLTRLMKDFLYNGPEFEAYVAKKSSENGASRAAFDIGYQFYLELSFKMGSRMPERNVTEAEVQQGAREILNGEAQLHYVRAIQKRLSLYKGRE